MKKIVYLQFLIGLCVSCGPDVDILATEQLNNTIELVFPENNLECTEGIIVSDTQSELRFLWIDANSSSSYTLHLTNLLTNENQEFESNNAATELLIRIDRSTPYSWYVSSPSKTQSETWYFYNEGPGLASYIPFPATAISPISGTVLQPSTTSIDLIWSSEDLDDDIIEFDLYFGTTPNPPVFEIGLTSPEYTNISLDQNSSYFWKIVTRDRIGNESASQIFSFTIE